jgi:hypothetical protein
MNTVSHSITSFKGLVGWLLEKAVEDLCRQVESVVAGLEEEMGRPEELKGWESIGKRQRTVTSLFGMQLQFARRGYRRLLPDGTTDYRYPLDELLGLRAEERFCPLVQHMAVGLAAKMSFRDAAGFMQEHLRVPVSHQEIHRWVQEAGAERERELQAEATAVFEQGTVPECEGHAADLVAIEADGIWLHLQRENSKTAELKLGVMHEGWKPESPARRRFRLANKTAWAGFLPGQAFWERGAIRFAERYDRKHVGRVVINGDGAGWVKEGKKHFEGAELYLDPFHRNRAIRHALGFAPALVRRAFEAIYSGQLDRLKPVLAEALATAPGEEHVERIKDLSRYLRDNWEGLLDWRQSAQVQSEHARGLGAAEAQINHVLARRMTKRGMSWRTTGAHHMALLRCLDAEERLPHWLEGWQKRQWPEIKRIDGRHAPRQVIERLATVDPQAGLIGRLPLLASTAGAGPLGQALKRLVQATPASELTHTTLWPWPLRTAKSSA